MTEEAIFQGWIDASIASAIKLKNKQKLVSMARHYADWKAVNGLGLAGITSADLTQYYATLRETYSPRTARAYLHVALRIHAYANDLNASLYSSFSSWVWPADAAEQGRGGASEMTDETLPSVTDLVEHFRLVYSLAPTLNTSHRRASCYRRLAMAEMIYGSGLRPEDIIDLPTAATRVPSAKLGYLDIATGNGIRLVPFTSSSRKAIELWHLAATQIGVDTAVRTFPSLQGPGPLLPKDVMLEMRAFERYTQVCPVGTISATSLRTAHARHLLARGADLRVLGHTMNYKDLRALKQFLPPTAHAEGVA